MIDFWIFPLSTIWGAYQFSGFQDLWLLFEFYSSRWFTRQIIEYTVYPLHLINNSAHHLIQNFIRNLCSFCCHKVNRLYSAKCNSIIISSLITHNTNRTHIGQCCEVLVDVLIQSGFCDLFSVNRICILNDTNLIFGNFTDDTDTKPVLGKADGIPVSPEFQAPVRLYEPHL